MKTPDLINGAFEFLAALAVWHNVAILRRTQRFEGMSVLSVAFFTVWGFWNLYFYPHLGQLFSAAAAGAVALGNAVFFYYAMRYRNDETNSAD